MLNFGHTFGHASIGNRIEDILLHGEAVAIGMNIAFDLSVAAIIQPMQTDACHFHHCLERDLNAVDTSGFVAHANDKRQLADEPSYWCVRSERLSSAAMSKTSG